jgi:hypothetical protein
LMYLPYDIPFTIKTIDERALARDCKRSRRCRETLQSAALE